MSFEVLVEQGDSSWEEADEVIGGLRLNELLPGWVRSKVTPSCPCLHPGLICYVGQLTANLPKGAFPIVCAIIEHSPPCTVRESVCVNLLYSLEFYWGSSALMALLSWFLSWQTSSVSLPVNLTNRDIIAIVCLLVHVTLMG